MLSLIAIVTKKMEQAHQPVQHQVIPRRQVYSFLTFGRVMLPPEMKVSSSPMQTVHNCQCDLGTEASIHGNLHQSVSPRGSPPSRVRSINRVLISIRQFCSNWSDEVTISCCSLRFMANSPCRPLHTKSLVAFRFSTTLGPS